MLFFFFSSRRRHTRLQGDWSSDVCSSDLVEAWKLNPDLVLALKESHAPFVESFNALPSATEEESKLYAVLSKDQKKAAAGATSSVMSEIITSALAIWL